MQAKLTREETSEVDALPEEVLEKEKELIILNEISSMTEKKMILDVTERCLFFKTDEARIDKNSHVVLLEQLLKFHFLGRNAVVVPDPPRLFYVVVVPFVVVA